MTITISVGPHATIQCDLVFHQQEVKSNPPPLEFRRVSWLLCLIEYNTSGTVWLPRLGHKSNAASTMYTKTFVLRALSTVLEVWVLRSHYLVTTISCMERPHGGATSWQSYSLNHLTPGSKYLVETIFNLPDQPIYQTSTTAFSQWLEKPKNYPVEPC